MNARAEDALYRAARASGSLSLTGRGLRAVPPAVFSLDDGIGEEEKWWECVDLQRLDLTHNAIAELAPDVGNLTGLVSLRLAHNALRRLPREAFAIATLKQLDASDNAITTLPESVGSAGALVELSVSNNQIRELPDSVGDLRSLEVLRVDGNELAALPESLGGAERLLTLCASNNRLGVLPGSLGRCARLASLELRRNALASMGDSLRGLTALTLLDLRDNDLTDVPALPAAPALSQLFLGANRIGGSLDGAAALASLPALGVLDVSDNKLSGLPSAIAELLPALHTLDARNNDLAELPTAMGYMSALTRIALEGNPLRSIRRPVLTSGANGLKKYLRSRDPRGDDVYDDGTAVAAGAGVVEGVDVGLVAREAAADGVIMLANLGVARVPPAVFTDDRLRAAAHTLAASGNKLHDLPDDVAGVSGLTDVQLSHNELEAVPRVLATLPLVKLDCSHNALTADGVDAPLLSSGPHTGGPPLPPPMASTLCVLDLRNNALRCLPTALVALTALRELHLAYNRIEASPGECAVFSRMPSLTTLNLGDNKLSAFPVTPAWLPSLTSLSVQNNDLRAIPPHVGLATQLRALFVEGNPQKSVRHHVLSRGTDQVLEYLRDRLTDAERDDILRGPPAAVEMAASGHAGVYGRDGHRGGGDAGGYGGDDGYDPRYGDGRGHGGGGGGYDGPYGEGDGSTGAGRGGYRYDAGGHAHSGGGGVAGGEGRVGDYGPSRGHGYVDGGRGGAYAAAGHGGGATSAKTAAAAVSAGGYGPAGQVPAAAHPGYAPGPAPAHATTTAATTATTVATTAAAAPAVDLLALAHEIAALEDQMQYGSLSDAKRWAVKKQLAKARAAKTREERRLKSVKAAGEAVR